jgi:hypothetical protein
MSIIKQKILTNRTQMLKKQIVEQQKAQLATLLWSRLPTKMAAKLKIEKRGDEILIVHCCFSISQTELKF